MMMARLGQPTPEQAEAADKAARFDNAMSAIKWLAIGGGALFLITAIKGRQNAVGY